MDNPSKTTSIDQLLPSLNVDDGQQQQVIGAEYRQLDEEDVLFKKDDAEHSDFQRVSDDDEDDLARDRKRWSRLLWVQACYISVGAILGAFCRMIVAQLFGEECANPGTVGWLSSGAPLCVTQDGDTLQEGGVIFSDLPANMLGCFLMGMVVNGEYLHLALPMPLAWLKPDHPFQSMEILHNAFKTGFCGSLTTFSSWNSAMVVLIFGTGSNLNTQIWLALLGYIVGMETAQGSFAAGKSLARFIHGYVNPTLVEEAQLVRVKREEGVYIHCELPDYERRVLLDLDMEPLSQTDEIVPLNTDCLIQWRESTKSSRRVNNTLLPILVEIERAALILNVPIPKHAEAMARDEAWDIGALQAYVNEKSKLCSPTGLQSWSKMLLDKSNVAPSRWLTLPVASFVLWFIICSLAIAAVFLSSDESTTRTYRTMALAMLVAPFGACLRWKLGALNGSLSQYPWFPLGTFTANVLGSLVSIICVALEYRMQESYLRDYWIIAFVRVTRIGFAGCLSTVSTFCFELNDFVHKQTNHAYPYMIVTILSACLPSMVVYAILVYAA
ncbi:hypothetical protein MPSEU_000407300 [Mayamaea pseudoterrestris]|nr:hypothetical protein MPSEU_000407300 [Mayamaea pseudoterrestris]